MTLQILSVNLDSLYLTVKGDLKASIGDLLAAAKSEAQDNDRDGTLLVHDNRVAGGPLYVSRTGRGRDYPYIVYNSRFRVSISTRGGNRPTALVQVRSDLLYEYELTAINTMLLRLFSNLVDDGYKMQVNRADLCCDFQQPGFELPSIETGISRARKDTMHRQNRKISGLTFGQHQSALQVQVYKKSETLANDGKLWFHEVWAAENERFDPLLPVFRVEVRFYREGLRLMKNPDGEGLDSLWNLDASLSDLAAYAITGEKPWMKFVDERYIRDGHDRTHSSRWDHADWWLAIGDAFRRFEGSEARKRVNDELRFHYLSSIERAVSHLKTAAAISRLAGWHPATSPAKFASDAMIAFFAQDPLAWADLVNGKLEQLVGHFTAEIPSLEN